MKPFLEQVQLGGAATGTTINAVRISSNEELEAAFAAMEKDRPDAVIVQPSLPSKRAAELALQRRVPAVSRTAGPIAFLAVDFDPHAKGYVSSLSRPGGNVTGIFVRQLELAAKRVEIVREALPRASVVGIAFDATSREQRDVTADAARKLGLEPRLIELGCERDYASTFGAMADVRGQPIILPAGPVLLRDRAAIAQILGCPG